MIPIISAAIANEEKSKQNRSIRILKKRNDFNEIKTYPKSRSLLSIFDLVSLPIMARLPTYTNILLH